MPAAKRCFDLSLAIPGLFCLLPLFALTALWIKMDSNGPVFFRQVRIGQYGIPFRILKFRTMKPDAELQGAQLTVGADSRITRCGRLLRKYKLDELPQLFNVVIGEMSLVGPRPEVPKYVELYPADVRDEVLSVLPGITDFASIEYKDENMLLAAAPDPERTYVEVILPRKLEYYRRYVHERSLCLDFRLILLTIRKVFVR